MATEQILISDCIGKCVIYRGHLYEVVAITNNGNLTLTNGRLNKLEVSVLDVTFLTDTKKGISVRPDS